LRERGFAALLSPTLWLAIGCALLAGTTWLMYNRWTAEVEKRLAAEVTIKAMVAATEEAKRENDRVVEQWKLAAAKHKADLAKSRADMATHLERLRQHPIDTSGREVAVTTCPGSGPNDVPQRVVPASTYESLLQVAASDALQVTQLQDYITGVCLAR